MCCLVLDVGACVFFFFLLRLNANMLLTAVLCSMHHVALAWRTCGVCVCGVEAPLHAGTAALSLTCSFSVPQSLFLHFRGDNSPTPSLAFLLLRPSAPLHLRLGGVYHRETAQSRSGWRFEKAGQSDKGS